MSVLNPKSIVDKNIIRGILNKEKQLQPNSIDLTIKNATLILDGGILSETSKQMPRANENCEVMGRFVFEAGRAYDVEFNESVIIPEGMMAFITHRSTLNRIGGMITSGIYDTGFDNYCGAILRTTNKISIDKDTRIASIYFLQADEARKYDGQYQRPLTNT